MHETLELVRQDPVQLFRQALGVHHALLDLCVALNQDSKEDVELLATQSEVTVSCA